MPTPFTIRQVCQPEIYRQEYGTFYLQYHIMLIYFDDIVQASQQVSAELKVLLMVP